MVKLVMSYGGHKENSFKCLFMGYKKHDVKPSRRGCIEGMRAFLLIKIEKEL